MKNLIDVSLAGMTITCALRYQETARYFPAPNPAATRVGGEFVFLSDDDWRFFLSEKMVEGPYSEYSLLTAAFSDALMDHDRMILHSVALRWQDKAYLIAARSGTGKSTQARCLQELRAGEFGIICGDRPILEFCHCEPVTDVTGVAIRTPVPPVGADAHIGPPAVLVHPSPWNGKENWFGAEAAPLAGLILLERGDENRLTALSPREAAIRTYAQVIQLCDNPAKIRKAAELTTRLLNSVPIWQLTSFQVPASTELLLESVFPAVSL